MATAIIDRYLSAVGSNLPRKQRDDILRELSADLRDRIDDRATAIGRPLTEDEQVALLKEVGEPMAVAARYRGAEHGLTFGRRLIGPELFPSYRKILGLNVAITLIVGALIAIAGGPGSIWTAISTMAVPLVLQFALVTGIFVAVDRRYASHPDAWDPRQVDAMGSQLEGTMQGMAGSLIGPLRGPTGTRIAATVELAVLLLFLSWWLALSRYLVGAPIQPGPGWASFQTIVVGLFLIWMVPPAIGLIRPDLRRARAVAAFVSHAATVVVAAASLVVGDWLVVDPVALPPSATDLETVAEGIIAVSLVVLIGISAVSAVLEVRRFIALGRGPTAVAS